MPIHRTQPVVWRTTGSRNGRQNTDQVRAACNPTPFHTHRKGTTTTCVGHVRTWQAQHGQKGNAGKPSLGTQSRPHGSATATNGRRNFINALNPKPSVKQQVVIKASRPSHPKRASLTSPKYNVVSQHPGTCRFLIVSLPILSKDSVTVKA